MKKTLFNKATADNVIERVNKLQPGNKPRWGTMTATEMLLHSNLCNEEIFQPIMPVRKTRFKQYLLRMIALYMAPNFKKGIKGDPGKETVGKIAAEGFEQQKLKFIELIRRFPEQEGDLTLPHIAFGNISKEQWGIAAYKHMNHHLRQFGV
ncbi:DUF1569 domain-containing protein [Flavisolibacter ginsengisoli]|jgi:hypothetical protein|uniref:DUF1569 domain-containing protein n=1 Tax=Flavisolibacter ginsengisoli DSM 18119 TaxID=1121884 RepID=A0A1M5DLC0_9BACT|nr:DUF1569 domain-containing protein [Flavisolibacter ginsengisoli]SHF67552.1 Protein of unknown function [Flavisolibacter ginsengisoli DSM 18119]